MTPESLVRETENLFSLPDVALRVTQLIEEPKTRPDDLAEVILYDAGLAARLLRLVNSALYARPRPVETVSQAIHLIGFRALRDLVVATYAVEMFKGLPRDQINMERLWFHGVACGLAARELAARRGVHDGERLFLAGLFHNLGKLIFFSQCANTYVRVLELIEREQLDPVTAEERVFGFNYAQLGAELLKAWRFPASIWQAVAYHLTPEQAPEPRIMAEILHSAERVASFVQAATLDDDAALAARATEYLDNLAARWGLAPDALVDLTDAVSLQVVEVFEILMPGATLVY